MTPDEAPIHTFPNRLGILGWLGKGRHGVERYLYVLHRITGLALLLFLLLHVFVTSSRLLGREVWERLMALTHQPLFQWAEFLVYLAFAFHALNGVRLILVELGFAAGRAEPPVYPYRGSLQRQRPLMIALMIVAAVLMLTGGFEFFWLDR
jgi:succinate dehydrogenase / fumarate reductase cytochrome b subunit